MAFGTRFRVPRGTRAALNTLAGAAGLLAGEVYLITDESRLAVALSTTTYEAYATSAEVGGLIFTKTASYTAALVDRNNTVEMNVATANNFTVPPNSTVAFPIGTRIDVIQYGAGQTTIVAGAGVTVRSASNYYKMARQYDGVSLYKRATDEWVVIGSLVA